MDTIASVKHQELGIKILHEICNFTDYLTTSSMNMNNLKAEFSSTNKAELITVIAYLKQRKYLKHNSHNNEPYDIYLTEKGVDLILTLEGNKVFSKYSTDFSTEVLQKMRNKI